MKKWIRWQGLFGFILVVAALVLFFVLFIDTIIKNKIESTASEMVGARVELASADFHFSPLGMELAGLQVTDPERPMRNMVEIERIGFDLDGLKLLGRKLLIREMQVDGVRFDTPRKTSGALGKSAAGKTADQGTGQEDKKSRLPELRIPDADEILAREEIKTLEQAKTLKSDISQSEQKWREIREKLPAQVRIEDYSRRLDKIKKTNVKDVTQLASAVKELKQIETEIKADIASIDKAYKQIDGDLGRLDRELEALKASPKKELQRLLSKYSLTDEGLANFSQLLFGNKAKKYIDMALEWYRKLEPLFAYVDFSSEQQAEQRRSKGVEVRFRETSPTPDFLVEKISASVETKGGRFSGRILNLTNEQNLTGKPVTLKFAGKNMKDIEAMSVSGVFNRVEPGKAMDKLAFNMKNYPLTQYPLLDSGDLKLALEKAQADIKLDASRNNDKIRAEMKLYLHAVEYRMADSSNEFASMLMSSLKKTRDFNIDTRLQGTLTDYTIRIRSDLDERLKGSMKKYLDTRLAGLKQELQQRIDLQVRPGIDEVESRYDALASDVNKEIAMRRESLDRQLKSIEAEIKRKEKQATGKARNEIEKNIKGLLNKYK